MNAPPTATTKRLFSFQKYSIANSYFPQSHGVHRGVFSCRTAATRFLLRALRVSVVHILLHEGNHELEVAPAGLVRRPHVRGCRGHAGRRGGALLAPRGEHAPIAAPRASV